MRLEALPNEIVHLILEFSRPYDFDSLAATCKTVLAVAEYQMDEHKQCKRNIAQMDASTRLRLLVDPSATLKWLCQSASSHSMEQLRYVNILGLDFPPQSSGLRLRDSLALARLTILDLYGGLQGYACDIWEAMSGDMPLEDVLELPSEQFVNAGFPFTAPMLCQLALIGLTCNASILIVTKAYLAYMHKTLERVSASRLGDAFLREIKEAWISDHSFGADFNFNSCAMSVLSRLPQLQAVVVENLEDDSEGSRHTENQVPQLGDLPLSATILILFDTIWTLDAVTRTLSLFPKLRSFVWRSKWHGRWEFPSADPFEDDDVDDPDEVYDYADWFQKLRADYHRLYPLATRTDHGGAELDDLHSVRTSIQTRYRGRGRGGSYSHRSRAMCHTSRLPTYQQLARDADELISDKSFGPTYSDGEVDLDESDLDVSDRDDENLIPYLEWHDPDTFQPSLLLNALCQTFADQLEHLAISVFGSIQGAAQIARRNTVVHFLHLHELTHLDLDTRILRPRKGSVYQFVSLHQLLPPSIKQLALIVLHCFLSAQLRTLLGQLPLHRSSQPQLIKIFVRIMMSGSREVTPEDEACCETLRLELARVNICFEWRWIASSEEVRPGMNWDDSSSIMPFTYSMEGIDGRS